MTAAKTFSVEMCPRLAKELDYSVNSTFSNMFGIKPIMEPHQILSEWSVQGDVSGIITLTQEKTEGTLVVCFPKETIFAVLQKMYQKPFGEINQTVKMGVGELTNIIYAGLKTNLNKEGFEFKMAVPSVIIGDQHVVHTYDTGPAMIFPFKTDVGSFHVLISFHQDKAAKKVA